MYNIKYYNWIKCIMKHNIDLRIFFAYRGYCRNLFYKKSIAQYIKKK